MTASKSHGLAVDWAPPTRFEWDALAATNGVALQQDWAYGAALSGANGGPGADVMRAVARDGARPVALAQFLVRALGVGRRRLARLALCTRGPVWVGAPCDETKAAVFRALRASAPLGRPRVMMFSPEDEGRPTALRRAGLRRVMTGFSTVMIDLRPDLDALARDMQVKWRNRLRAAEKAGLQVVESGRKAAQYQWLVEREAAQRAAKGYAALPPPFTAAYQAASAAPDAVRLFRADKGREKAAAMLFLTHGRAATYHLGWASAAGRATSAHNLLLWRAIQRLKADGFEAIDLGGVNTETSAGVARFKLGTGGRVRTLCGSYL